MAEYIERKELLKTMCGECFAYEDGKCTVNGRCNEHRLILNAPAADVVEVVRCKDCKHWDERAPYDLDNDEYWWCHCPSGLDDYAKPDDFCSYGEIMDLEVNNAEIH